MLFGIVLHVCRAISRMEGSRCGFKNNFIKFIQLYLDIPKQAGIFVLSIN